MKLGKVHVTVLLILYAFQIDLQEAIRLRRYVPFEISFSVGPLVHV